MCKTGTKYVRVFKNSLVQCMQGQVPLTKHNSCVFGSFGAHKNKEKSIFFLSFFFFI